MYLSKLASRIRILEAENARNNRLEIVKALSHGQITKRDLFRWGLYTTAGTLALKNGLSPFAKSAYAAVPTGTPRSPLGKAKKFDQPFPRAVVQPRHKMYKLADGSAAWGSPSQTGELPAKRLSYHEDFTQSKGQTYKNPLTNKGPIEGRPDTELFAHQRWDEMFPEYGYLLSLGQIAPNTRFHPGMEEQRANSVWSFGTRGLGAKGNLAGSRFGQGVPPLVKLRYGEPVVTRIYNDLPDDVTANEGFGRNEISTHFHNAHNGAESDGACNAYHFPGTFYDYHWGTTMARRDMDPGTLPAVGGKFLPDLKGWSSKCSGPDDKEGCKTVPGDFREAQGTLWFHDHRFFFTAENVHKGNFALCNMYSGPDRGREDLADVDPVSGEPINLRMPSGTFLPWGNIDFDVNMAVTNPALKQDGNLFFDIFDTDGFLGDMLLVNGAYYPVMQVLPRRYRFRFLNAAMARFIKLALAVNSSSKYASGTRVPFYFIANDGNFVVKPIRLTELDEQGVAERYDIVVDFAAFSEGDEIFLVNLLQQTNGRKPDGAVSMGAALAGVSNDPAVGPILKFKVVETLQSVDDPTKTYTRTASGRNWVDKSADLSAAEWQPIGSKKLTEQIPIVAPVRERVVEWVRSSGDSRSNPGGVCIPECGDIQQFPWSVKINGQSAHSLNANRIGILVPKPGEVEHWTYINGGGGWDHPIHLHFEEGVTINRGNQPIPDTERLVRKDVWRLRPSGTVKFQVRFGEFGGAYVNHCHNTIHEDFAMLLRYQLLTASGVHSEITKTPMPSRYGVSWKTPEVMPGATSPNRTTTTTTNPPATTVTTSGGGKGKG